jgi:hypothetical protein
LKSVVILSSILILGLLGHAFGEQAVTTKNLTLDHPGLKWNWKIKTDNYTFVVDTISNYDMKNVTFNKSDKELIFMGISDHTGNIAEIEIPHDLIDGNLTVFKNSKQIFPLIINSGSNSLVVLKFNETGDSTTNIIGTTYLPEFANIAPVVMVISFIIVFLTLRIRKF